MSEATFMVVNRDKFIELAHKVIGVLETGQQLDGEQLQDGIDLLNILVRETDASGRWKWTVEEAAHVPLVSLVGRYASSQGLPTDITELVKASFRDANGNDVPLKILRPEAYEGLNNKLEAGQPKGVYLTETADLTQRALYVWPVPSSVNVQSTVSGPYACIRSHTSTALTQPGVGANWRFYWSPTGAGGSAWALSTVYTAPAMIRLLYRRPLDYFANAASYADTPISWPRLLLYDLAFDLGDIYSIPIDERTHMIAKAKGARDNIFPATTSKSTEIHNKVSFF